MPALDKIPVGRLAPIVEREIAKRATEDRGNGHLHGGGFQVLARELAAGNGKTEEGWAKRLQEILKGNQRHVEFGTADTILTVLGLNELWLSELRDLYGVDERPVAEAWCPTCREWTLTTVGTRSHRCLWCDGKLAPIELMLERKAEGRCECCGVRARGLVGGHRLCNKHEPEWARLGPTIERRLNLPLAA